LEGEKLMAKKAKGLDTEKLVAEKVKSYKGPWKRGLKVTDEDRALAMDRALIMSELFQKENFEKIVKVINTPVPKGSVDTRQKDFMKACPDTITNEQKKWLWNYLKNYDPKHNWASTGW
jgi:hypothetical protein